MNKKNIKLIITDLDNTLYDWFVPWYKSFTAFINDVLEKTEIGEDELLSEIKKIHQRHGTSEYTFDLLLKELTILAPYYPENSVELDTLKHHFYKTKKSYLMLYPGVMEALLILKSKGCMIVAYSESMEFYSKDRIRKLGLDGVLDALYTPEDHDIPQDFKRYYTDDYYNLKYTKYFKLPLRHKKPDPEVIDDILKKIDIELTRDEVLYIGDSLTRDISMAQESNIIDVYAEYGVSNHKSEYELLRKVTHWTSIDVEREKSITKEKIEPSYVLSASFSELFNHFTFNQGEEIMDNNEVENLIKMWDRSIDVQKHFNELGFQIKQFAISLSSLILGGIFALVVTSKMNANLNLNGHEIYSLSLGFYFAAAIWFIFFLVDRYWYHILLKGAVMEAINLEEKIKNHLPITGLTNTIGKYSSSSKINIFGFKMKKSDSSGRLNVFYWSIIFTLILIGYLIGL